MKTSVLCISFYQIATPGGHCYAVVEFTCMWPVHLFSLDSFCLGNLWPAWIKTLLIPLSALLYYLQVKNSADLSWDKHFGIPLSLQHEGSEGKLPLWLMLRGQKWIMVLGKHERWGEGRGLFTYPESCRLLSWSRQRVGALSLIPCLFSLAAEREEEK